MEECVSDKLPRLDTFLQATNKQSRTSISNRQFTKENWEILAPNFKSDICQVSEFD